MLVPSHAEWKAFKNKLGIPNSAVSGINMGKPLNGYDKALNAREQAMMASVAQALSEAMEGNDEIDGGTVKNTSQQYRDKVVEITHSLAGDTAKTLVKDGVITKA